MTAQLKRAARLARTTLLGGLVLATMAAVPAQAQAAEYYQIRALHSNRCLDVAHASAAHMANVLQATCVNGYNQQWEKVYTDSNYFKLRPRHVANKCLDVAHGSIGHMADVIQADCWSPGYNQQWGTFQTVNGYGQIRARHSNKCLDVAHMNKAHGADVIQGDCWNGDNQRWRFFRTS